MNKTICSVIDVHYLYGKTALLAISFQNEAHSLCNGKHINNLQNEAVLDFLYK